MHHLRMEPSSGLMGLSNCRSIYLGESRVIFSRFYYISLFEELIVVANHVDPAEMSHYVAFHLGLRCMPTYSFWSQRSRVKEVISSPKCITQGNVSLIHRNSEYPESIPYSNRKSLRTTQFIIINLWASSRQTLSLGVCEQQKRRPACVSVQTDLRLYYSSTGKYRISTCFKRNFNLASLCS